METVTIKELQHNLYKAITKLPVIVTKYGKPIFVISSMENKVATIEKPISKPEPIEVQPEDSTDISKPMNITSALQPFTLCKQHKVYISSCGCN